MKTGIKENAFKCYNFSRLREPLYTIRLHINKNSAGC